MDSSAKKAKRTVLIVDDDVDCIRIAKGVLEAEGHRVEVADSGERAIKKFVECDPSLVLLDVGMPGIDGFEALRQLRMRDAYISVLFVSGRAEVADVVRGLDAGADDYIMKPFDVAELAARVRVQLRIKDVHDRMKAANQQLLELIDIDDLTELFNMRSIYARLDQELVRAKRFGRLTSAIMMDIDDFKQVNDQNDHLFGSFVLKEIGKIIRETIRRVDLGARFGGDEFLLILPETGIEGSLIFADRLRKRIEEHLFQSKTASVRLTASFGVAICDPARNPLASQALVRCADLALYEAKSDGKNCIRQHQFTAVPAAPKRAAG